MAPSTMAVVVASPHVGQGGDVKAETVSGEVFRAAMNVVVAVVAPKRATPMGRLAR